MLDAKPLLIDATCLPPQSSLLPSVYLSAFPAPPYCHHSHFPFLPRMTMAVANQKSYPEPPSIVLTEILLGKGCNIETIPSGTKKEEKKTEKGRVGAGVEGGVGVGAVMVVVVV